MTAMMVEKANDYYWNGSSGIIMKFVNFVIVVLIMLHSG